MKTIIIVVIAVVIFIVVTILNMKTKIPDGIELPDKCDGCKISTCKYQSETLSKEVIEKIKKDISCQEENDER